MPTPISRRRFLAGSALLAIGGGLGRAGNALSAPHLPERDQLTRAQPRWGVYRSGAPGDMAEIAELAARVGTPPSFVLWYEAWTSFYGQPAQLVEECQQIINFGATPMLTWLTANQDAAALPAGYGNAEIASGSQDAYIAACAVALSGIGARVALRLNHEMNGSWLPYAPGRPTASGAVNTPQSFVAMWRHVVDIFRDLGATNVDWVWSPNVVYKGSTPLNELYPGDAYVDVLAIDGYNHAEDAWSTPLEVFAHTYHDLLAINDTKPVMIAEIGTLQHGPRPGESAAAWIRQIPEALAAMPRISSVIFFDAGEYALGANEIAAVRAVFGADAARAAPA